jgi:hypothetical protein
MRIPMTTCLMTSKLDWFLVLFSSTKPVRADTGLCLGTAGYGGQRDDSAGELGRMAYKEDSGAYTGFL